MWYFYVKSNLVWTWLRGIFDVIEMKDWKIRDVRIKNKCCIMIDL